MIANSVEAIFGKVSAKLELVVKEHAFNQITAENGLLVDSYLAANPMNIPVFIKLTTPQLPVFVALILTFIDSAHRIRNYPSSRVRKIVNKSIFNQFSIIKKTMLILSMHSFQFNYV